MADWGLLVPFLNHSADFAHGAEIGMLFMEMKRSKRIRNYFLIGNQEQITLMANRLGWRIKKMEPWEEGWFWLDMKRN